MNKEAHARAFVGLESARGSASGRSREGERSKLTEEQEEDGMQLIAHLETAGPPLIIRIESFSKFEIALACRDNRRGIRNHRCNLREER